MTVNLCDVIRAMNNVDRLRILCYIHRYEPRQVKEMYIELNISANQAAKHITILREADLIFEDTKYKGKKLTINYDRLSFENGKLKTITL